MAKKEAQVAKIPMMVQRQVRQTIEEKTEEHLTEIRELNASHSRELSSLQVRLQNLSARYRELESNNRHIIDNLKREKDTLLAQILPKHTVINSATQDLAMVVLALMILLIVLKPKDICSFLGLDSNLLKGFLVVIVSVLPLYIVFPLIGSINQDYSVSLFVRRCVFPSFFEEFLCRAFMFGLFFRYAKVGFFWATILPAIGFGIMHIYQGHDILSSLAAFGVTFLGALYFSWMYVAWNYNLWVPIGLHMLMNTAWGIFNVTGTEVAAGGLISNVLRIASITLAIAITVYYHRKKGEKVFDYPVFSF